MKNTQLSNYCRWNDYAKVSNFLTKNDDINIKYDGGIYFKFAFKFDNSNILDALLSYYYKQNGLNKENQSYNYEERVLKQNLLEILKDCIENYAISEEVKQVLEKYSININDDNSEKLDNSFTTKEVCIKHITDTKEIIYYDIEEKDILGNAFDYDI